MILESWELVAAVDCWSDWQRMDCSAVAEAVVGMAVADRHVESAVVAL